TGIVFFLALYFVKVNSPITAFSTLAIGVIGFLGYRIGSNIAISITRSNAERHMVGGVIGLYVGIALGCYLRIYIPVINELTPFKVHNEIPIWVIFLLALVILAIFGAKAYALIKKNENAINAVTLPKKEQDALDENLREIDRYFIEKEAFDNFQ